MVKAEKLTEQILKKMGVTAQINIEEKENAININIETDDSGLLIGYHGETLNALQLILGIILNKGSETSTWQKIIIDIGEYREQRQGIVERMVERAVQKAKESNEEQELPIMPAFERRIAHLIVSEKEGVISESRGEGKERRVIIKPE